LHPPQILNKTITDRRGREENRQAVDASFTASRDN
jgi:hypothetical protein